MPFRPSPFPLFLCLALVWLMPLAPLAEASTHEPLVHMPAWSEGDQWIWKKEPTSARGSRSYGNLTWIVAEQTNLTLELWEAGLDNVTWRRQHVWLVNQWLNNTIPTDATSVEIRQTNLVARRVADLALVRSETDDRYTIDLGNGSTQEGRTERMYERFAPLVELQFPFTVGDAWRVRTEQRYVELNSDDCGGPGQPSCRGGGPKGYTYSVAGTDRLTIQVNGEEATFDAYRIKVTDETTGSVRGNQAYEIWWYAPEVCNLVKREQYSVDRQMLAVFTLTDYRCGGGTVDDPDYGAWAFDEFSSTRFHGALSDDALNGLIQQRQPPGSSFLPGPPVALLVVALFAVVAVAGRRQ